MDTIKRVEFRQTYVGHSSTGSDKRMMLKSVDFISNNAKETYRFEYDSQALPMYDLLQSESDEWGQCHEDYWGYYNGTASTSWLPKPFVPKALQTNEGANRDADEKYSKALSLKKIIYPTGSCTDFVFESNRLDDNSLFGGLRLKSYTSKAADESVLSHKWLKYENACPSVEIEKDLYTYSEEYCYSWNGGMNENLIIPQTGSVSQQILLGNPAISLNGEQGALIHYGKVTEYEGSETEYKKMTEYEYMPMTADLDYLTDADPHSSELPIQKWDKYYNYDRGNNEWVLWRKSIYDGSGTLKYKETADYRKDVIKSYLAGVRIKKNYVIYEEEESTGESLMTYDYLCPSNVYFIPTVCLLTSKETEQDGMITKTTFTYDSLLRTLQPLTETRTLQGNATSLTEYTYTFQSEDSASYKESNVVDTRLATLEKRGSSTVSQSKDCYEKINGRFLLASKQYAVGNSSLEERLKVLQYDKYGNIQVMLQDNNKCIILLWGYSGQYPIAKIECNNANRSTIWTRAKAQYPGPDCNATDQILGRLRYVVEAAGGFITTYKYKPLVGITECTDVHGQKFSYQYDSMGRLISIENLDGNVIEQYEYHYTEE